MAGIIIVEGCPVANGGKECVRGCGGRYPISTEALTEAVKKAQVNTDRLCGPLTERVQEAQASLLAQAASKK